MSNGILPLAAMEKIMKKNGANRVSADAKEALRDALEELGRKIADRANQIANVFFITNFSLGFSDCYLLDLLVRLFCSSDLQSAAIAV